MSFDYAKQPGLLAKPRQAAGAFVPLVSVVTPFYNAGEYFEQTFNCVVNQTFPWFEWIIVNDGSTNAEDVELLRRTAARDARVRVVGQPNGRLASARNRGIAESKTGIIIPLDADDLMEATAFECLYWALLQNPGAGWAYTDSTGFGRLYYLWRRDFSPKQELRENLLVATAAIRKAVFDALGGYRVETGLYYEDWIFWVRALAAGFYPAHLQGYSFWYRRKTSGLLYGMHTSTAALARADAMVQEEISRCTPANDAQTLQYPLPAVSTGLAGTPAVPTRPQNMPDWADLPIAEEGPCTLLLAARLRDAKASLAELANKGHRVLVAALYPEDSFATQELRASTEDLFSLPEFLTVAHYPAFLRMLAQTRGVTQVLLDNIPEGLLFWQAAGQGMNLPVELLARDDVSLALAAPQLAGQGSVHGENTGANTTDEKNTAVPIKGLESADVKNDGSPVLAAPVESRPSGRNSSTGSIDNAACPLSLNVALNEDQRALYEEIFLHYHAFFLSLLQNRTGGLFSAGEALPWPGDYAAGEGRPDGGEPLVSILLPPLAGMGRTVQLLRSLLAQTFPWYEILTPDAAAQAGPAAAFWQALRQRESRVRPAPGDMAAAARGAEAAFLLLPGVSSLFGANYLEMMYWGLCGKPKASYVRTCAADIGPLQHANSTPCMGETVLLRKDALAAIPLLPTEMTQAKIFQLGLDIDEALEDEAGGDGPAGAQGLISAFLPIQAEYRCVPAHEYENGAPGGQMPVHTSSGIEEEKPFFRYRPKTGAGVSYVRPVKMDWTRKVYPEHNKIHLLMVLPWMVMGGADRFNLDLLAGLDKNRYRVSVLTSKYAQNLWAGRFSAITAEVYPMAEYVGFDNYSSYISYFIQSRDVDVLMVSNSYFGYELLPWLRLNFPQLALVDYVHMEEWTWRQGGFARASGVFGNALEKTYVCNGGTRKVLIERFGRAPDSVETVYIGTDAAYYTPDAVMPGLVYQELGLDTARPIVLFACRLAAQKRPLLMLAIARLLKERGSNAAFVVVGDGPLEEAMRAYVAENALAETVYFAGRANDLRAYYRDAALTLVCSFMEGLSLTTYESMAMETPVVTSDVGGQAELVGNDTGRVLPLILDGPEHYNLRQYPPEETAQYADAIEELLASPDALVRRSRLCREKVLNGFTIQNMVAHLAREFCRLTGPDAQVQRQRQCEHWASMAPIAEELVSMGSELASYECLPLSGGMANIEQTALSALIQQSNNYRQELVNIKTSLMYRCTSKIAALLDKLKRK